LAVYKPDDEDMEDEDKDEEKLEKEEAESDADDPKDYQAKSVQGKKKSTGR